MERQTGAAKGDGGGSPLSVFVNGVPQVRGGLEGDSERDSESGSESDSESDSDRDSESGTEVGEVRKVPGKGSKSDSDSGKWLGTK